MGKSKKTRWRTFEIVGSQDETQTNGADVKVNGTDSDLHTPATSQKYSHILGDHHTNSGTHQFNKNSSSHNVYKSRNYNNKENFYNQRTGGRPGVQRSWQRGGNYRTSIVNGGKDKRLEQNEKTSSSDVKVESTAEPIKFNEDEYTRITTPRQDVLFKKGYLSRMSNKTATNLSATVNSSDSTAASSTITSDPDSSVSTLSPATTPSMDYGPMDSMEYPPMYYPGYYDENGMLVIPMYNGYNYYPPNGSSATSPVYLMPYPYQYDPFFMTPSGLQPVDDDENAEDKTESDGATENNQHAEKQNGARTTSSSSEDGASSHHGEEKQEEKKANGTEDADESPIKDSVNPDQKPNFPVYPNELNGYMYPAYPNGYYNNFYYYNGAPATRPPKMKRRKRFLNSRNSQNQPPRSAETTTDYSDEENTTHNKRFNPRYQNGWAHGYNGYNHYNEKFQRIYGDQNANQALNEFHLNVDVQEFYPRAQSTPDEPQNKINCDEPFAGQERNESAAASPKPKVTKTSHPVKASTNRVSKKEIIEGIKSMEQQNIDLMATKHQTMKNASQDDEWNVIKNGRKVKVVKDIKELTSTDVQEVKQDKIVAEEKKIEELKTEVASVPEVVKKSPHAPIKPKKSKGKNKKKKSHLLAKQDGFEIIEPEFNNVPANDAEDGEDDDVTQDMTDDELEIPSQSVISEPEAVENVVLNIAEAVVEPVVTVEQEVKEAQQKPAAVKEKSPEVNDLPEIIKIFVENEDDAVIDISDEDISRKVNEISLEITSIQAVVENVEQEVQLKPQAVPEVQANIEIQAELKVQEDVQKEVKQEIQEKQEVEIKKEALTLLEVHVKKEAQIITEAIEKPEVQLKVNVNVKSKVQVKQEVPVKVETLPKLNPFQDTDFFNNRKNIADLERDLIENLRLLDDEIDLKSPIINPLYDFPITSAVRKWLQAKENESFDNLFHVQNFKKLSELFEDEDDDEDETESDISEKELKSETDSDYASDFQAKANGGSPTCSTHAKGSSEKPSKCNKLIAKESFCALM